jgi:GalNAc-alpha-(1->4)-GalNAc-alpha-(1->3)-diNAcBac-PP-undecaprenol alpha-1,4-N-acetyl-D-galactosaminyltransferase
VRISFVITSLSSGGAERVVSAMANYWSRRGKEIKIAVFSFDPPFYELDPAVSVSMLGPRRKTRDFLGIVKTSIACFLGLRRFLAREEPDIVVSFLAVSSGLAALAMGKKASTRLIAAERTNPEMDPLHPAWLLLRARAYRRAALVVAQTERAADYCRSMGARAVTVVANPLKPGIQAAVPGRRSRIVLSVGRMTREKGHDLLLEAFSRVRRNGWRLVLVGDGSERLKLERLASDLGIRDKTDFIGVSKDVDEYYRSAGIFVLPSRYEGFPNALCEAMAFGTACISFDCPNGPAEIIRTGHDGIIVPPGDIAGLADAIERLISNGNERVSLGEAAVSTSEKYGIDKIMGVWDKLVERVAGIPEPASRN